LRDNLLGGRQRREGKSEPSHSRKLLEEKETDSQRTAASHFPQAQQFTATVQNTTNTGVTWRINNIAGGDSIVGTISTNGLYTAPLSPPETGMVTITAVSQADSTKSGSATVTIVFSNATLSGQYVFFLSGNATKACHEFEGPRSTSCEGPCLDIFLFNFFPDC